jgi:hypothetical protein
MDARSIASVNFACTVGTMISAAEPGVPSEDHSTNVWLRVSSLSGGLHTPVDTSQSSGQELGQSAGLAEEAGAGTYLLRDTIKRTRSRNRR